MKSEQQESMLSSFSSALSLNGFSKYGSLIEVSNYKKIRNGLISLASHFYQSVPLLFWLHKIITVIRFCQLLAPSFLCGDNLLFTKNSPAMKTSMYLALLFRGIPASAPVSVLFMSLILYSSISLTFCIIFYISSIYFQKTAKIPDWISNLLCIWYATIGYIGQPGAASIIGEMMLHITRYDEPKMVPLIIVTVASVFFLLNYFYLHSRIFVHSVILKPDSIPFVLGQQSLWFIIYIVAINFFFGLSTNISFIPKLVCFGVCLVLYATLPFVVINGPSFVNPTHAGILIGICISGTLNITLGSIFVVLGIHGDMIFIVVSICSLTIAFVFGFFIHHRIMLNSLMTLDRLDDEYMEIMDSMPVSKFLKLIVVGFQVVHEQSISFNVIKLLLQKWNDDPNALCTAAKFLAVFPGNTKQLLAIQNQMVNGHFHSRAIKHYVHQILSIADQRENILTPNLKKKISSVNKKMNAAKRKIQNIWDYVIQSNISELPTAIDIGYRSVNAIDLEISKLKKAFPNNSFVSRIYIKYLQDIKHNDAEVAAETEVLTHLRRGSLAAPDRTFELGINAFPNLVNVVIDNMDKADKEELLTAGQTDFSFDEDYFSSVSKESAAMINKKIMSFRLPAIRCMINGITLVVLIMFVIPIILLLSFNKLYINSIFEVVPYMESISLMRSLNFQMASLIVRIALEDLCNVTNIYPEDYFPINMNNSKDLRTHLNFFISQVGSATSEANQIRNFKRSNQNMNKVRSILFEQTIEFQRYISEDNYVLTKMSAVNILMDTALHASRLPDKIDHNITNKTYFLTPRANVEELGINLNSVLTTFNDFVLNQSNRVGSIVIFLEVCYSALYAVTFLSIFFASLSRLKSQSNQLYLAFTLLPKAEVVNAIENLHMFQRSSASKLDFSTTKEDLNRQEETIIKFFNTMNENTSGNIEMIAMLITVAFIALISSIVGINLVLYLYGYQYDSLYLNAPHIDYIMGTIAYINGAILNLNSIALSKSAFNKTDESERDMHIKRFKFRIDLFNKFFNCMRYGGRMHFESSFVDFDQGVKAAENLLMCKNEWQPPSDLNDAYHCYDVETQYILFGILSNRILEPDVQWGKNMGKKSRRKNVENRTALPPEYGITASNENLNVLWTLGTVVIYDTFVNPLHRLVETSIIHDISSYFKPSIISSGISLSIVIISVIIFIYLLMEMQKRVSFLLSLVLHINPSVVLQNEKITKILGGEFSSTSLDISTRNTSFYEEVFDKLINGVIVVDELFKVVSVNNAILTTFNVNREEFIGSDVLSFFNENLKGDIDFVTDKNHTDVSAFFTTFHAPVSTFEIKKTVTKQYIIYHIKNDTARVNHTKLIMAERQKSDQLLGAILPPALVPRVQSGESLISFAVQSSSILFLDIVSFTPWCGKNKADYIMKILNDMFKELDRAIAEFPTMTKVKCIGDCYMAAGGIFDEVNQPAVHARECVEFGLRAINIIEQMNKKFKEDLQIRVGINTGGPLVAGVIGTEKPTFEILGPPINMAQQMEHHGVPMKVHVSRSTYELIYGNNFNIVERGIIEIKNGKASTYIVSQ